jgi:glycosyltransferase involved in cell wall biosynthesis
MKIAIQAADLDHERIDGTRVYILNLLKHFGKLDQQSEFLVYHRSAFNPELTPPNFPNYQIKTVGAPCFWTQSGFAWALWKDQPAALWMPMHNIPLFKCKGLKTFVTIHDLAYKYFPEYFTKKDLRALNFLGDMAINRSDKIIAVSQSTKRDILKFYPHISPDKIRVIYHGFDAVLYTQERDFSKEDELKNRYGIAQDYILYSGAIQPRKNLTTLISAFEIFKQKTGAKTQLVLAGGNAWLWEKIVAKTQESPYKADIIMPGKLKFDDLGRLMQGAAIYVFPSFYEGFGIPVLEALASKIPLIVSDNSSLPEVAGEAALNFKVDDPQELAEKIELLLSDEKLRQDLIAKGLEQVKKFSWEKCAKETLEYLKS